jgi:hypothetical protein
LHLAGSPCEDAGHVRDPKGQCRVGGLPESAPTGKLGYQSARVRSGLSVSRNSRVCHLMAVLSLPGLSTPACGQGRPKKLSVCGVRFCVVRTTAYGMPDMKAAGYRSAVLTWAKSGRSWRSLLITCLAVTHVGSGVSLQPSTATGKRRPGAWESIASATWSRSCNSSMRRRYSRASPMRPHSGWSRRAPSRASIVGSSISSRTPE